jgi:hypothetical protein
VIQSQPFSADDKGNSWHVHGHPDSASEGGTVSPWNIKIRKSDGAVTWLGRTRRVALTKEMLRPVDGWNTPTEEDGEEP